MYGLVLGDSEQNHNQIGLQVLDFQVLLQLQLGFQLLNWAVLDLVFHLKTGT